MPRTFNSILNESGTVAVKEVGEDFCPPGDIWQGVVTCWVRATRGAAGVGWSRPGRLHRPACQKPSTARKLGSAKAEKLASGGRVQTHGIRVPEGTPEITKLSGFQASSFRSHGGDEEALGAAAGPAGRVSPSRGPHLAGPVSSALTWVRAFLLGTVAAPQKSEQN